MTIGTLARRSGVSPQTLRYYERLGLLAPRRAANGYRLYDESHVETLAFIKRLQRLGLSLSDAKDVLTLRAQGRCPCGQLRTRLSAKTREIAGHIEELQVLQRELEQLLASDAPLCQLNEGRSQGVTTVTVQNRLTL